MNNIYPEDQPTNSDDLTAIMAQLPSPRECEAERIKKYEKMLASQFVALPMGIFADLKTGKLTYRDVCCYCYLIVVQRDNLSSYWTANGLGLLMGIDESGVKDVLKKLKKAGHIERIRTGPRTAHTVCRTFVKHGKGKNGIVIKGQSPAQFLESQIGVPKKKRQRRNHINKNASQAPETDAQTSNGLANDDEAFFAEFDEHCKPKESFSRPSAEESNHILTWGVKPVHQRGAELRRLSNKYRNNN